MNLSGLFGAMVRRLSLESNNLGLQIALVILVDVEYEVVDLHALAAREIDVGGSEIVSSSSGAISTTRWKATVLPLVSNSSCFADTKHAFATVFISIHPFSGVPFSDHFPDQDEYTNY